MSNEYKKLPYDAKAAQLSWQQEAKKWNVESTCVYKVPKANETLVHGTMIVLHGGCFMGGSPSWDSDQNMMLAKMGYDVHQLYFPKSADAFDTWALGEPMLEFLEQEKKRNGMLIVLGRSSGGYLAKRFRQLHMTLIDKTIYLCPVFSPMLRAKLLPQFSQRTERFFGSSAPIDTGARLVENELLLLASNDGNVPKQCFTEQQLGQAVLIGPETHIGALKCRSERFAKVVEVFLNLK